MKIPSLCIAIAAAYTPHTLLAAGIAGEIEETFVDGQSTINHLDQSTEAASVGTVISEQITHRPILRPAEILETIPGMVITQHSGGGKANQYFLRGFNLDHSTDFASFIEGAPVNNVTHGHGHGYTDLNFLIPELVEKMVYKKGPYYASSGDFSSAGSAHIEYAAKKETQKIQFTLGEDGYRRALFLGGASIASGDFVYALEEQHNDGPWETPDALRRHKGFLKYTQGDKSQGFSVSALYFESNWAGTDQIPQRLVKDGTIGQYGTLDDTTGGDTHRYQLSVQQWSDINDQFRLKTNAYVIDYALNLFGNFTYFTNDDEIGGHSDQVSQFDDRITTGFNVSLEHDFTDAHTLTLGTGLRHDNIKNVGVGKSDRRQLWELDTRSGVKENAYHLYSSVHSQWTDWFASILGLRFDHFTVDVKAKGGVLDLKSGDANDNQVSPKLSLRFGPFKDTRIFINYGQGFHSNDARGVINDDVPLIASTTGYELGIQNNSISNLQFSAVLFQLDLDSELVFVGDDGSTEPKDGSRRQGIELSMFYQPFPWFIIDADYAKSQAKFKRMQYADALDGAQVALGDYVPDSIEDVFSMGMSVETDIGVYAGLRLRYFGPRNLDEAGEIKSGSSATTNANIGYQMDNGLSFGLEVLNLFDSNDDDITYYYASRTAAERDSGKGPEEDYHSHPMIPRTFRASVAFEF